jgi:hypothetical protein
VHAEQGNGDLVHICRYQPFLPQDGVVIVEVQAPLVRLVADSFPGRQVVTMGGALPPHDVRCPIMSLPLALGLVRADDIPTHCPYLAADPASVAHWRGRLTPLTGKKVGLAWAGNPDRASMDRRRSIPLSRLAPLLDVPDITLVSLQKGQATAQIEGSVFAGRMLDWTGELEDFADTAALISALDLVIGVDTAVVHLAGALARPVWLLNRADTDWRWQVGRDDSPWYPTLRQFRQDRARAWEGVITRVRDALAAVAGGADPQAVGEVTRG